jgi:hypothetical protein
MTNRRLSWSDLSLPDRRLFADGCGRKGGPLNVPDFIFTARCDQHDFYYWRGGTYEDRARADRNFLKAMLADAYELSCGFCTDPGCPYQRITGVPRENLRYRYSFLRRNWYALVALTYYAGVRLFGVGFFHYGEQRDRRHLLIRRAYEQDLADRKRIAEQR